MARTKKVEQLPKGFSKYRDGIRYRFYLDDGTRVAVYGDTIEECIMKRQQKCEQLKAEKAKLEELGLKPSRRHYTVMQYATEWLEAKRGGVTAKPVKPSSVRQYDCTVNRIVNWKWSETGKLFGSLYLEKVEPSDVRRLQREIADKLSTETANYSIMILGCIYKMAVDDRIIDHNPCGVVKPLPRVEPTVGGTKHRALSHEEAKLFLETAKGTHYYNLYTVLLYTGMRIGEAGALTLGDIAEDGVYVKRTLTRNEVGANVIGNSCKTEDSKRFIPLHPEAMKAIERQKRINSMLSGDNVVSITEPIFKAPQGGLIVDTNVNTDIGRLCKRCGIEKFTAHAFRSSCITEWSEIGVPMATSMEMSGHRDVRTHRKYQHPRKEQKIAFVNAVNW